MTTVIFGVCGMIVGMFFSVVYGLVFLMTGGMPTPSGTVISPITASVTYILSCGLAGILVGSMRALLRSTVGSAVVGTAGMLPVMLGGALLYYEGSVGDFSWWTIAFGSVVVGVPIGLTVKKEYASSQMPRGR